MAKFQRYHSYKDSGVEWLGEIPVHWEARRVKNIFRTITKYAPKGNNETLLSIYTDIGVKPRKELPEKGNKASTTDGYLVVEKNDFIVNKMLAWMGAIGLSEYKGVTSPAYEILRAKVPVIEKFYHELFRLRAFSEEIKKYSRGIMDMRLALYFDKFGAIFIPVPPKDEQEKIASYLDEKIAKIDTAISGKEKLIELLKEQKQIIINDAVTKGLNKNAEFKDSGLEWVGQIPKHWEMVRLGSLGVFSKGNGISRNELVSNGVPAILYGDIYTKYNYQATEIKNFISLETSAKAVKISENDILLTGSGETKEDIGKCIVFKGKEAFAGGDIIIFKQNKNNSTFLGYSLNSSFSIMQKIIMSRGEIIVHIYSSSLKELLLPLPPQSEQEQIVEYIENKTNKIDKLVNLQQEYIERLKEYKTSLIDSVVTGKVKV